MAKSVVVVILSIFTVESMLPEVDLTELSRLPELWSHFQKHQIESPGISFIEFLNLHYDDPQHFETAPVDHQKLPFSKNHRHRIPSFQIAQDPVIISFQTVFCYLRKLERVHYPVIYPNTVASSIWQPPKV
jgi:hypothetical protein